jgi:hypothetical protein
MVKEVSLKGQLQEMFGANPNPPRPEEIKLEEQIALAHIMGTFGRQINS